MDLGSLTISFLPLIDVNLKVNDFLTNQDFADPGGTLNIFKNAVCDNEKTKTLFQAHIGSLHLSRDNTAFLLVTQTN